jgi:hypothetical protein
MILARLILMAAIVFIGACQSAQSRCGASDAARFIEAGKAEVVAAVRDRLNRGIPMTDGQDHLSSAEMSAFSTSSLNYIGVSTEGSPGIGGFVLQYEYDGALGWLFLVSYDSNCRARVAWQRHRWAD